MGDGARGTKEYLWGFGFGKGRRTVAESGED